MLEPRGGPGNDKRLGGASEGEPGGATRVRTF